MGATSGPKPTTVSSSIVTDGLVLHLNAMLTSSYPGTGTIIYDISGSGLNATGSTAITNQEIRGDQAFATASTSILNDDTHTICFLIKVGFASGSWNKIFEYAPAGTDRSPGLWRWPTTRAIHWRYDPGNTGVDTDATKVGGYDIPTGEEFDPSKWYYVCVTKNGATAVSYVNGYAIGTVTVAEVKTAGSAVIRIFQDANLGTDSKIRAVQIYNRVLSAQEIRQNLKYLISIGAL